MPRQLTSPFTPQERDLIRLELMPRFGQEPDLANGPVPAHLGAHHKTGAGCLVVVAGAGKANEPFFAR